MKQALKFIRDTDRNVINKIWTVKLQVPNNQRFMALERVAGQKKMPWFFLLLVVIK